MPQCSTCDMTASKHVTELFLVIGKFAFVCSLSQALYLMAAVRTSSSRSAFPLKVHVCDGQRGAVQVRDLVQCLC